MARKILVVDDSIINRKMLINLLEKEYDIIEAENGKEALALMNRNYKLLSAVLLDIVMPEMDGYELLRSVRDNLLLAQIPIIMVTGSEDESSRVKALSLGANDFITKPFNPEIIKHCLRNNIAQRETASILNAIQKDKLTGLFNRSTFFEKVDALIKEREPGYYMLSCFDIDNFKIINDQYGAAEGDRILKEIAHAVHTNMNSIGGLAGRISADNFAVLFPADKKDFDILQAIVEKKVLMIEHRSIAFSIGRYIVTDISLPASAIYDRAYIAKQSVKGRYDVHFAYFDETMLEKLVRDQQITNEMETALKEHQFEVWFQPQYNHVTGAVVGSEALVRWRHPEKGMISPGEFIPLFEQNGFIYELDKFVWREVCAYIRKWIDEGLNPLPVSVNISRYDIFRADLIDTITSLISEFNISSEMLHLEITESAFAKSTKLIVDIVKQMVTLGFTVEIDDFGSGYSSLNTLKSVPAQVVKLDMRFLEDEDEDAMRGGNILESVVRMTKWLGMSIIAEGVETKQQGDFLKSIGCSHVQGYLYARPMCAEDYEKYCEGAYKEIHTHQLKTVGNLNNDMFWNPKSIDSLIFNSYVGAACIYEYHNGKIELLRATDKYAHMLGGEAMTVEKVLKLDLSKHLDKKTSELVLESLNAAIAEKGEVIGEYLFIDIPGCPHEVYLRSTMRIIASVDDRYLVYCISENITVQRQSERKERMATKHLQAIMDNINCGITAVSVNGDKANFLLANDKYFELLGYTRAQFEKEVTDKVFTTIYAEDEQRVKEIVERTRISGTPTSMEYRVVRRDGSIAWMRSFFSVTEFEEIEGQVQLCTYADVTAEKNAAQDLLDNLPYGVALFEIDDQKLFAVHLNKRYWELVGRSPVNNDEISVMTAVHTEDRAMLMAELDAAIAENRDANVAIRILYGKNEYHLFRIIGRLVRRENGKYYIYASYTPISDEANSIREMLPVALAAVMASSTELSFVKDKNLRYICCSREFAKMVGIKNESEIVGKTDYELFDKAFADQYVADDRNLIKSGKSIIDSVETIPSKDNKNRFSSTSKYLLYDSHGNVVGIYGSGRDVTLTREAASQQDFIINNIPGGVAIYEGVWSTLASIKLTYFSEGFCRLFGYEREEYAKMAVKNPLGLVFKEFIPEFMQQIENLVKNNVPIDYIYRAQVKDAGYRWIHIKAVRSELQGESMKVSALFFDVTERQNTLEQLRISEEENRLAIAHSGNVVCRYEIASRRLRVSPSVSSVFKVANILENVPYSQVDSISPETLDDYVNFYEKIIGGEQDGTAIYQRTSELGWRWVEAHFSTIYTRDGKPVSSVISFSDVTERLEKDAAYTKWLQSIRNKKPESYSLFRCNISKDAVFDTREGSLFEMDIPPGEFDFNERTMDYVGKHVVEEDCERVYDFLNVDSLMGRYYNGERILTLEYREKIKKNSYRWIRLTVDLVKHSHSAEVEAYLLFENIDKEKREELLTIERAQTDPLTGMLNRTTFAEKVDKLIRTSTQPTQHALLMLDIDGFKLVNDTFGHGAGDQALIEIGNLLRTVLRRNDLVGRLGGDEFVVFISDVPGDKIVATKAKQICDIARKAFSTEVQISGSVGIAVWPRDGNDFETLYKKADETLYYVKDTAKDNFAFYHEGMKEEEHSRLKKGDTQNKKGITKKKRRMLIVDDSKFDNEMLSNLFREDFIIEKAKDGNSALIRLRHYGSAISVVLLDLMMPGMDGFAVMKKMRQSAEMCTIPIIVVSGDDNRETALSAIRGGAADFVTKPVDPDILKIRVESAISKAENERLRAKNSFLELQNTETVSYRTVLDRIGLVMAEMDWTKGTFLYSNKISEHIAGSYDDRTLWHIFLSDMVADAQTVKELQQLVHKTADNRECSDAAVDAQLLTPCGEKHSFRINIYKITNEYALTDKIVFTFKDMGKE